MRNVLPALVGGLLLLATAACGGGGGGTGANGTGANGNGGNGTGANGASCPENLAEAPNSEFCDGIATTPNCNLIGPAFKTQVCGVPVIAPTVELSRSQNVTEFGGSGPPDLGCFNPATYPKGGVSQKVTMKGVVKIFSHGCDSKKVTIEVYDAKDVGTAAVMGTPFTTSADCIADGVIGEEDDDCGVRHLCNFTYPNVDTEKELVILTKGQFWAPLYDFNIYISNDEVKNGVWEHDVRALAADDYTVIPQAAIGGPITPGHGAIAGEVHDCGDVRLKSATVDVNVQRKVLTYFTENEDHPLPDLAAESTSVLALYSALDVAPGEASVAALGLVNGKVTTLGYQRVKIFPDSVTAVTFRGVRPYQLTP